MNNDSEIIAYNLLNFDNTDDLSICIRDCINDGYQPLGNILHHLNSRNEDCYIQAMVKYYEYDPDGAL